MADIIELEKRRQQHLSEKKDALQDEKIEVLRKPLLAIAGMPAAKSLA